MRRSESAGGHLSRSLRRVTTEGPRPGGRFVPRSGSLSQGDRATLTERRYGMVQVGTAQRSRGVSGLSGHTRQRLVGESVQRKGSSPPGCPRLAFGGGGPWKAEPANASRHPPPCFLPGRDNTIDPIRPPIPSFPPAPSPVRTPDGRTGTRRQKAQRVQIPETCLNPGCAPLSPPPAQPRNGSRPPELRRVPEKRPRSASGATDARLPQVVPVLFVGPSR